MVARYAFEYAVVRVVPHVEREEFVNAGVILFCPEHDFLAARMRLDTARLLAIAPTADVDVIERHLEAIARICIGGPSAGPIGELTLRERWRWLTSPRSTIVQTSPAHAGLAESAPHDRVEALVRALVDPPDADVAGLPSVVRL